MQAPDTVTDEDLQHSSGDVTSSNLVVELLYLLMRDHLPTGAVAQLVNETIGTGPRDGPSAFTNGWLLRYAEHLAARLERDRK